MRSVILLFAILSVFSISCQKEILNKEETSYELINENSNKIEAANSAMETFASAFARTLENKELRQLLKEELKKKFDGEYEILWRNIKDQKINSSLRISELVNNNYASIQQYSSQKYVNIDNLVKAIPRLHISMPIHFDKWDENTIPLVTYAPIDMEEKGIQTLNAYDSKGNVYTLDATNPPSVPVIVIGMNERTDDSGNLLYHDSPSLKTASGSEIMYVKRIYVMDLSEPWTKGSAEIVLQVIKDNSYVPNVYELFDNWPFGESISQYNKNEWLNMNWLIYSGMEDEYSSDFYIYYWLEWDAWPTSETRTLMVYNRTYEFNAHWGDDFIGYNKVRYSEIENTSYDNTEIYTTSTNHLKYSIFIGESSF